MSRYYSDSSGDYAIFRFREVPWASGVSMSGRRARRPEVQTLYLPEIFGLQVGLGVLLASVGFRRVHVGGSGTATKSSNSVSPGDIRILEGLSLF